jgi:hypothetical protein
MQFTPRKYLLPALPAFALQVLASTVAPAFVSAAPSSVQVLAARQAATQAPVEPNSWLSNGDFGRGEDAWSVPTIGAETVIVPGPAPNTSALRLSVSPTPGEPVYAIALQQSVDARVKKGDAMVLRFRARSPRACRSARTSSRAGRSTPSR